MLGGRAHRGPRGRFVERVGEVEEGVKASHVVQYKSWKNIDGAETWCGAEAGRGARENGQGGGAPTF